MSINSKQEERRTPKPSQTRNRTMSFTDDVSLKSVNLEPNPLNDEVPWGAGRVVVQSTLGIHIVPDMFHGVSLDFLLPKRESNIVPSSPTSCMECPYETVSNNDHFQEQTHKKNMGFHDSCRFPLLDLEPLESTSTSDFSESSFPKTSHTYRTRRYTRRSTDPVYTLQQAGRWQQRFMELVHFKNEYGHCCVPSHWPQNHSLAQWVKRQRSQRKLKQEGRRSNMTEQREQALTDLGFVWDSHSDVWEERLEELQEYKMRNGHVNVPTRYADNPPLAVWCKRQRRLYKLRQMGEDCRVCISDERIQKLEELGFDFCPRDTEQYCE